MAEPPAHENQGTLLTGNARGLDSQPRPRTVHGVWWFLLVLTLLLVPLLQENTASIDLWGKITIPAIFYQSGQFPYHDDLTFTAPGAPWIDHEWLSGFLFYHALAWGGDWGLSGLKITVLALTLAGVFWSTARRNVPIEIPAGLLLLFGIPTLVTGFLATGRPQIFTFCFFPWMLGTLQTLRDSPFPWSRRKTVLVNLGFFLWGILWGNLHAGFVAGAGVILLYALEGLLRSQPSPQNTVHRQGHGQLLLSGLAFLLGTLVNPFGSAYWQYIFYAITLDRQLVSEWGAIAWDNSFYWPSCALLGVTLLGVGLSLVQYSKGGRPPKTWPWLQWGILLILMWMGFRHIKHQPLFLLGTLTVLSPLLWEPLKTLRMPHQARWLSLYRVAMPLLVVISLVWACFAIPEDGLLVKVKNEKHSGDRMSPYPVGAMAYLSGQPEGGKILTPFAWGEFVSWCLYPRFRVSMDGRLEAVYPMRVFQEHLNLYRHHRVDWTTAERLGGEWLLTETPRVGHLVSIAANPHHGAWHLVYQDDLFSVFRKGMSTTTHLPARLQSPGTQTPWSTGDYFRHTLKAGRFKHYPSGAGQ